MIKNKKPSAWRVLILFLGVLIALVASSPINQRLYAAGESGKKTIELATIAYSDALQATLEFMSKKPYTLTKKVKDNNYSSSTKIRVDSKLNAAVLQNGALVEVYISKNWFSKTSNHNFLEFEKEIARKYKINLKRTWTIIETAKLDPTISDHKYLELFSSGEEFDHSILNLVSKDASWAISKKGSKVVISISSKKTKTSVDIEIVNGIISSASKKSENYSYSLVFKPKASSSISAPPAPYLDWSLIRLADEYPELYSLYRAQLSAGSVKASALSIANLNNREIPNQSDWREAIKQADVYAYEKGFEIIINLDKKTYQVCAQIIEGDFRLKASSCEKLGLKKIV